jgi:glucose uptake protein GlcU
MPLQLIPLFILGIIAIIIIIIGVKITSSEVGEVVEKIDEPLKELKPAITIGAVVMLLVVMIVGFKLIKAEF